eukprot:1192462-Prorocentrum_minimum.AAC.7
MWQAGNITQALVLPPRHYVSTAPLSQVVIDPADITFVKPERRANDIKYGAQVIDSGPHDKVFVYYADPLSMFVTHL